MWNKINYGAGGFWSSLGAEDFVFDPVCVYDWQSGRFIVENNELTDSNGDWVCLAVSKDSYPDDANDWWKFRYKVSPTCNFPDFPNLGVGRDYITICTDCFYGGGSRVIIFDKSDAMNGTQTVWNRQLDSSLQSMGGVKNYDSTNGYMYFVGGIWSAGSSIRIQCKQTTGTATPNSRWVSVSSFGDPPDARQQGSSNRLDTIDCRIKNGVIRNGILYAAHGIGSGGVTQVRWYQIDLRGWPTSGQNPTLLQEGTLSLGSGIYNWFPDVHADAAGNITVGYNRSSTSELPSTEASWRVVSDPTGTMPNVQSLVTSSAPYTGGRYGDYSGVDEDPASPGSFWGHAEYSVGPWETWIDKWTIDTGPDPSADFFGVPTVGDEDLLVTFTNTSTGTGLYAWDWDFGDTGSSALQHPTHLYVDPGTYTVSMSVTGTNGNDSETKVNYITVNDVPDAGFSYYNGSGFNPFIFTSNNLPVLGTNWITQIDGGSVGATGLTFAVAYSAPFAFMTGIGELLVDVSSTWMMTHISGGGAGISYHTILLPNDPALAGIHAYTQGLLNNVGGVAMLTNAIDAELGY